MKITLVRLSVLALAFTGFAAASVSSKASYKVSVQLTHQVGIVGQPQALCSPNDPSYCGLH